MASQKVRIFQGNDTRTLEGRINTWLSELREDSDIHRTETAIGEMSAGGMPYIMISVWYSEPD